ncbi:unnamed protein product [Polarella glacialis]|uniref:AAA+ ATPase domain-containing protein n=1 Tax=Polarella glacialis TaxID=89957 RepID=A0A813DCA1_POLGL|nr:unnamed protein product [Polarella glacialis]
MMEQPWQPKGKGRGRGGKAGGQGKGRGSGSSSDQPRWGKGCMVVAPASWDASGSGWQDKAVAGRTVVVSNLGGLGINRRGLEAAFSAVGRVESAIVGAESATITFREARYAQEAVRRYHGGMLNERAIDVYLEGDAPPRRQTSGGGGGGSRRAEGSTGAPGLAAADRTVPDVVNSQSGAAAAPGEDSSSDQEATDEGDDEGDDDDFDDVQVIHVFVLVLSRGCELEVRLPHGATVADLKTELETREGMAASDQRLSSDGEGKLDENEVLETGRRFTLPGPEDLSLLHVLPERLGPVLSDLDLGRLVDLVLDLDRQLVVHERKPDGKIYKRRLEGPKLTQEDLDSVIHHELLSGIWSSDNRSGVAGTLHRVSRIVDGQATVGLTLRMAHPIYGLADRSPALASLMEQGKSLLVLGPPGKGKTTLLRELARVQSEIHQKIVIVVDTSSEIGGFGQSPHLAIGETTRRIRVARRDRQHEDMLEAVQNHTTQVLVIDEIGSEEEVKAAAFIGFKGVALIATAHATDLKEAMNNDVLKPLFGGWEKSTVSVSDQTALRMAGGRKFVKQRSGVCVSVFMATQFSTCSRCVCEIFCGSTRVRSFEDATTYTTRTTTRTITTTTTTKTTTTTTTTATKITITIIMTKSLIQKQQQQQQ